MEMNEVYNSLKEGLKEIKNVDIRIEYLKKLRKNIVSNIPLLEKALRSDFNKPEFETVSTEVFGVISEIDHFIKHLKKWSKPKRVRTNLMNFPSKGYIVKDPMGVVYIASPWNYPFNLTFTPLVGAIGSGDTVILRPSNSTAETSKVIAKICADTFPTNIVYVTLGGHDVADQILELDLDMVFFTGSVRIGREIYQKAASHLSRVVLELGGKSPVIVLDDADIDKAAKRITWGKFINGGQTCIAPDYLIIDEKVKDKFITAFKKYINEFYYKDGKLTNDFPHVINDKNYLRLKSLLSDKVIIGGKFDDEHRLIHPTVIDNVKFDDEIMNEEIFGPILPIITIKDESEIYSIIDHNPNPLATYVFTKNTKRAKNIISNINFGGGCINDVVMHLTTDKLPFGGIKSSGLLGYHGYESFKVFTHFKSVLVKSASKEINTKYPPYDEKKMKITRKVGKF